MRGAPLRIPPHQIMKRSHGFTRKQVRHEYSGQGRDPNAAADLAIVKKLAAKLEQHYPCHPWLVEADSAQGVAFISLPIIMKRNQRYCLHLSTIAMDPGLRCVVRAGGEILERYNVPRAGFQIDHFLAARAANPANRNVPRFIITD